MIGALVIVVVLVVCAIGGVAALLALRQKSAPAPGVTLAPTRATESPRAGEQGAPCLVGDWLEVSYANTANIYGTRVQLTGKGIVTRYSADGVNTTVLENTVRSGSAGGATYEVIFNGVTKLNYQADATTIYYSSPQTEGTTTWRVNGKVQDTEAITMRLTPSTYKCQGNQLRVYSEDYAAEFERILPPGAPA